MADGESAPISGAKAESVIEAERLRRALERFRERIRETREAKGLSQYAAAALAGISQSNWSKIERGEIDPSVAQALRIQAALGVPSIESFFGPYPAAGMIGARPPRSND